MQLYGQMPEELVTKVWFFVSLFKDMYILSSFFAGFLASLTWMAALTKFELSTAYPFMSFSFLLVLLFSHFLLNESLGIYKVSGMMLIVLGIILIAKEL